MTEDCSFDYFEELSVMEDCSFDYFEELSAFDMEEKCCSFAEELSINDFKPKVSSSNQPDPSLQELDNIIAKLTTQHEEIMEEISFSVGEISFRSIQEIDAEYQAIQELHQFGFINDAVFNDRRDMLQREREMARATKEIPHKDYSQFKSTMKKKLSSVARNRNVRIFISSTFRDMTTEREILLKEIFPKLQKMYSLHGLFITQVDLRWGITTDQSNKGDTISICLKEVDNCRPYFICMLGQRYGWCQPENNSDPLLLKTFQKGSIEYPWIQKYSDRSITELEIRHAVLNNPTGETSKNSLFYFREGLYLDGDFGSVGSHVIKLETLKKEIKSGGYNVTHYKEPRELADTFFKQIQEIIGRDFPVEDTPSIMELKRMSHISFQESRSRVYVGAEYFETINSHMRSGKPVVVVGESGIGKSALLANWTQHHSLNYPDRLIVSHYIGSTSSSSALHELLHRILWEIQTHFGLSTPIPNDPKEMERVLPEFFAEASSQGDMVLVLDALDQLEDPGAHELRWLPKIFPKEISVLVSTLPGRCLEVLQSHNFQPLTVQPLDVQGRTQFVHSYMNLFGKTIPETQLQAIVSANQCGNPLFLKTMLEELRLFGVFEKLDETIERYLRAKNPSELFRAVFERLEGDFNESPNLVPNVLSALWASRKGLTEEELLSLLSLPQGIWAPLHLALTDILVDLSGLYTFFHDYVRTAVSEKYTRTCTEMREKILSNFEHHQDPRRRIEEVPYQMQQLQKWNILADFITVPENFFLLASEENVIDLYKYWKQTSHLLVEAKLLESLKRLNLQDDQKREMIKTAASFLRDIACYGSAETLYQQILQWAEKSGITSHVADAISDLGTLYEKTGNYASASPLLERALTLLHNEAQPSQLQLATVLNNLGVIYRRQGKYRNAAPLFEKALLIRKKLFGEVHASVARTKNEFGRLKQDMGKYPDAEELFTSAYQDLQSLLSPNHPTVALYLKDIGDLYLLSSRFDESIRVLEKVRHLYEQTIGAAHPSYAETIQSIASGLQQQGKWDEATQKYEQALQLQRSALGNDHPNLANTLMEYANLKLRQRIFDKAELLYQECLRIRKKSLGEKHTDYASCLASLGSFYQKKKQYDTSLKYYRDAMIIQEEAYGSNHIDIALNLLNTAGVHQLEKNYTTALPLYTRALAMFSELLGMQHAYVAVTFNDLGLLYNNLGNWKQSQKLFEIALKCYEVVFGRDHLSTAQMLFNFGTCCSQNHEYEAAKKYVEESVSIFEHTLGPTHEKTITAKEFLPKLFQLNEDMGF